MPMQVGPNRFPSAYFPLHNDKDRDFRSCLVNSSPGKLPRAILPPQRTFWGTILDAIVGDGPSKR